MNWPARVFDAHFHVIDARFPLIPNKGYVPADFPCDDYLRRMKSCPLVGGAVVSGSFQGFDQTWLADALAKLGPSFVGVTRIPPSVSDDRIAELDRMGVRAVRFNIHRNGREELEHLDRLARRIHEIAGWHVELYVDSRQLGALSATLASLPAVSIDHMGLSREGLPQLLKLVEGGVRVKATGFGRVAFNVKRALQDLRHANPDALMFGTDLPSTRAARPYTDDDAALVLDALGQPFADKVFYLNAARFYRMDETIFSTDRN
ncbi:MAG: amidohydrolase family protein [Sinobacteraceae bacterium]|nr:amidohydrolase family protein [Nevskiaceae bacterium]